MTRMVRKKKMKKLAEVKTIPIVDRACNQWEANMINLWQLNITWIRRPQRMLRWLESFGRRKRRLLDMMARGPKTPEKWKIKEVFVCLVTIPDVTRQRSKLLSIRLTLAFLFDIWQIPPSYFSILCFIGQILYNVRCRLRDLLNDFDFCIVFSFITIP